jgi:Fe-S cluster biogenesis protein NfuA
VDDAAARDLVERVEGLLDEVDALPDADKMLELVQGLVALYGEGLARIMALADGAAPALAGDALVAHLLLLHDLHPVPLEERVREAIEAAGGAAEVLSVDDGLVRLRAKAGSCASCAASAGTKQQAIEEAIARAAPDVERVEFVGMPAPVLVLPQVGA